MTRIVIAGSRHIGASYAEIYEAIVDAIDRNFPDITEGVSGTAIGADSIGEAVCHARQIPVKRMPANWEKFGKCAGDKRNGWMADYADGAICIWDGKSSGTASMIKHMQKRNKPVFVTVILGEEIESKPYRNGSTDDGTKSSSLDKFFDSDDSA